MTLFPILTALTNRNLPAILKTRAYQYMRSRERLHAEFNPDIKRTVLQEQEYKCAACGKSGNLDCHHIIPLALKWETGASRRKLRARENAVGLCSGPNGCHQFFDELALHQRVFFSSSLRLVRPTEENVLYHPASQRVDKIS